MSPWVTFMWGIVAGVWLFNGWVMLTRWLDSRRVRKHQREHRPRAGVLERADGSEIELRFIETWMPNVFLAVSQDGNRVSPEDGDEVRLDNICAGQTVVFEPPPAPNT